jgi:hypothetical protein
LALCNFDVSRSDLYKPVDHLVDSAIMAAFLQKGYRSIVFCNNANVSDAYPTYLRTHFFYMHVEAEIVRVEIPGWIAQSDQQVDTIATIIMDQCTKGYGYPIALAEAHEQAVVKGIDREFFYHLLGKVGLERKHVLTVSQKSRRKRSIGI